MLEVQDIHTYYGKSHVLHGISFKIETGEILGILGRNGVGKTTTIRSIIGLTPPREGKIIFDGKDITRMPAYKRARLGISLVPQGRNLFPRLSVRENLETGVIKKLTEEDLNRVLSVLPVLGERLNQKAGTLSGGEQQMLAIGRALVSNPKLILMDEPFEGLMPVLVLKLIDVIKQINKMGVSVLIVEQRVKTALEISHRILLMENGMIKWEGLPEELSKNPEALYKYLGVSV
ncbi:MAG: ABC transporter [Candidatus Hecatellales archaeon B24]|nr:MAG: ABC transporter [Candidatus Hecatellales archaeon B24]